LPHRPDGGAANHGRQAGSSTRAPVSEIFAAAVQLATGMTSVGEYNVQAGNPLRTMAFGAAVNSSIAWQSPAGIGLFAVFATPPQRLRGRRNHESVMIFERYKMFSYVTFPGSIAIAPHPE
jgi:hypothetical protein